MSISPMLLKEFTTLVEMFRTTITSSMSIVMTNDLDFDDFNRMFKEMHMSGKKGIFINHRNTNMIDFQFSDKTNACYKDGFTTSFTSMKEIKTLDVVSSTLDGMRWRVGLHAVENVVNYTPIESPVHATMCEIWEFAYNNWLVYRFSKRMSADNKYNMFAAPLQFQIELIPLRNALSKYTDTALVKTLICKIEDICGRYMNNVRRQIDFDIENV